jgi:pyruvate dehydrogenase E2 component (dihydrolipoamide acetyltransferase)
MVKVVPFILLPEFGSDRGSATLTRWLGNVGESVDAGQPIAELETETGYVIVEATQPGCIAEYLLQPGQTVETGAQLVRIEGVQPSSQSPVSSAVAIKEPAMSNQTTSDPIGKVTPILMPQAGNTMEEGTVVAWRVQEGDLIAVGQVICEIETDKATMDFESPDAGRLARIVAQLDEPVAVKHVIALLADRDSDADAYLRGQKSGATSSVVANQAPSSSLSDSDSPLAKSVTPAVVMNDGRVKASPAARKLATERNLDLSTIALRSGPGGRILTSDLTNTTSQIPSAKSGSEIRRPMSKMRRAIGLNLQQSKQTVPHFYIRTTINVDALLSFYREHKQKAHCSLNDIIVLAVGRTMREFPAVRSQIVGNEIVEFPHANIGIAVGIDDGLVVPVVLDVDTLPLDRLALETKHVVEQARSGRLENIGKGHFTISNLGMFGVEEFSAIINPPESGILAVSAARETVIVEHGAIRIGHQMTMTLSADHRIVDGVMAAKFMQRLRAILEHPAEELA